MNIKHFVQQDTLAARCIRACGWGFAGGMAQQILRLVRLQVLAWILLPSDFGVMSLISGVLLMLQALSDAGMQQALIQNPGGEYDDYLNSAWSINLVRNIGLMILVFFGAPFVSMLGGVYASEQFVPLLRLSALILFFDGYTNVSLILMQKRLEFKRYKLILFSAHFIGLIFAIITAYIFKSALALVLSEIIVVASICFMSYKFHKYRPRFSFNYAIVKELLKYGFMVYILTIGFQLSVKVDIFYLGLISDETTLGIYNLAMVVIIASSTLFLQINISIGFPTLAKIQFDNDRLQRVMIQIVKITQSTTIPFFFALYVYSDIVVMVLPEKYRDIGTLLSYLSVYGYSLAYVGQFSPIYYVTKKLHWLLINRLFQLCILASLFIPFYKSYQINGICLAVTLALIGANIFITITSFIVFQWPIIVWIKRLTSVIIATVAGALIYFISLYILSKHSELNESHRSYLSGLFALIGYGLLMVREYRDRLSGYLNRQNNMSTLT